MSGKTSNLKGVPSTGLIATFSIRGVGAESSRTRLAATRPHLISGMCVDLDLERSRSCLVETRPERTPASPGFVSLRPLDLKQPRSWPPPLDDLLLHTAKVAQLATLIAVFVFGRAISLGMF